MYGAAKVTSRMAALPSANSAARSPGEPRQTFSIADLADEFEITPRTIRFYEDKGLLSPERQGLQRIYGRRDRARLRLILRGKRLGFTLAEIGEMLDLYDLGDGQSEQMRHALRKGHERLASLERQRRDLDEAIGELKEMGQAIEQALREREGAGG